jgi:hypothetical protein
MGLRYHGWAVIWLRRVGVLVAMAFLVYGTVLVFLAFDRQSHSASDTLRPFIITMAPVWAVATAAVAALLRRPVGR